MSVGCVVAGQLRAGIDEVLNGLCRIFDHVVLSTWKGSERFIPSGDFKVILNDPPPNSGIRNRNYQRVATRSGIAYAESLGCDYLLKWRPDMLPTDFSLKQALDWANYNVPKAFPSRIVMSAFRNLSVLPDWLSSFPDMYAFGHIEMIKMLWSEGEFNVHNDFNLPVGMTLDKDIDLRDDNRIYYKGRDITDYYTCHAEHYSYFKDAMQNRLKRIIQHPEICLDFLYPANHERWKILWWREMGSSKFRSYRQMANVPWITESAWRRKKLPSPISVDLFFSRSKSTRLTGIRNIICYIREMFLQRRWHNAYRKRNGLPPVAHEPVLTMAKVLSRFQRSCK